MTRVSENFLQQITKLAKDGSPSVDFTGAQGVNAVSFEGTPSVGASPAGNLSLLTQSGGPGTGSIFLTSGTVTGAPGGHIEIQTGASNASGPGHLKLATGSSTGGGGGYIDLHTGTHTGAGGNYISITVGAASAGSGSNLTLTSSHNTGATSGPAGSMTFQSGNITSATNAAPAGNITMYGGNNDGLGTPGAVTINAGSITLASNPLQAYGVSIYGGNTAGTGPAGNLLLVAGSTTNGGNSTPSGNVQISGGNAAGSGTAGAVMADGGNSATGPGGAVSLTAGSTSGTTNPAGNITITAGQINNASSSIPGGFVGLFGGGTSGSGVGGSVVVRGGPSATGDDGYVKIQNADSSPLITAGNSLIIIDGYTQINNDLAVTGKLYLDGLIDPTGIVVVDQASVPGGSPTSNKHTLWVRNDGELIKTSSTEDVVIGGGFTAGQDLSGNSTSQTVIGVQTKPIVTETTASLDEDRMALRHHNFNMPYDGAVDNVGNIWIINYTMGPEHPVLHKANGSTKEIEAVVDLGPYMIRGHYYTGIVYSYPFIYLVGVYDGRISLRIVDPVASPPVVYPSVGLLDQHVPVDQAKIHTDGRYLYVLTQSIEDNGFYILKIDLSDPSFAITEWASGIITGLTFLDRAGSYLYTGGGSGGTLYEIDCSTMTTNTTIGGSGDVGVVLDGYLWAFLLYNNTLSCGGYIVPGLTCTASYSKHLAVGDTLLDVVTEPDSGNIHAYCQQVSTKDPYVCVFNTVDPPSFGDAEVITMNDFGALGNPKARWFNERWLFRSSTDAPSAIYDENLDVGVLRGDFDDVRWETCTADISKATDGNILKAQGFPWNVPVAVAELNGDIWIANSNQGAAEKGGVLYRVNAVTGRCTETLYLADYSIGMNWICDIAASGDALFVLGLSNSNSNSVLFRIVPRPSGIQSGVSDLSYGLPPGQNPQRLLFAPDNYVYALLDNYLIRINPYDRTITGVDLRTGGLGGTNRDMVYGLPDFDEYSDNDPRMFVICNGTATGIMRCRLGAGTTYEASDSSQSLDGNTLAYADGYLFAYDTASGNLKRYTRTPTFDIPIDISSSVAGGDVLNINAFDGDTIYIYCGGANPIKVIKYYAPTNTVISEANASSILGCYGVLCDPRLYYNGSSLYVPVPSPVPTVLRNMVTLVLTNEATWAKCRWRVVYWKTVTLILTGNNDTNGVMYRLDTDAAGGDITVTLPDAPKDGDEILLKQTTTGDSVILAANTGTIEGQSPSVNCILNSPAVTDPNAVTSFPFVQLRYDSISANWDVTGGLITYSRPQ